MIVLLLLLAFAALGLKGGVHDLPLSETAGETVQSAMQLAYGVCALQCAVTTFRARRWARLSRIAWIVSCALAAGLASVVWGGTTLATGLLAGAGGAAMAFVVTWLLTVGARGLTNPDTRAGPHEA